MLFPNVSLVVGSISVALGAWGDLGAVLLGVFLVPVTLVTHGYWRIDDPVQRGVSRQAFFRNVGALGACLMLFGMFTSGSGGTAVTPPLLGIR